MKPTIIFINDKNELKWALNYKRANKDKNIVIISTTSEGQVELIKSGIETNYITKLDSISSTELIKKADLISKSWYRQDKKFNKNMVVKGANLGQMLETTLFFYLVEAIRSRQFVTNVIKQIGPREIIFSKQNNFFLKGATVKDARLEGAYLNTLGENLKRIKLSNIQVLPHKNFRSKSKALLFIKNPLQYINLALLYFSYKFLNKDLQDSKDGKRILIFAQRNHLTSFLPLIKDLDKSKLNIRLISSALLKTHLTLVYKDRVKFSMLESQLDEKINLDANKISIKLRNIWNKYRKDNYLGKLVGKLGLGDLEHLLLMRLDYLFNKEIDNFVKYILVAERNILEFKPHLVIVMTDTTPKDMSFTFCAQNLNVKSLLIQHGTLVYKPLLRSTADHIAAWGTLSKNWWIEKIGKKENVVTITGPAQFDEYKNIRPLKFSKKRILNVLLATTFVIGKEDQRINIMKNYFDELKTVNGINLRVRTYAGRIVKDQAIDELAKLYTFPIVIDEDQTAKEQIQNSDLVISETTSFALDAMIMGKPVIYANYFTGDDQFPFASSGAAIGAYKNGDIKKAIAGLTLTKIRQMDKSRKKFLKDECFKIDGKSSRRIIDLITNLVNNTQLKNG